MELKTVALFAPPNCTGNSGVIGDTILQTSLVRTLLDRSLFPDLQKVHWWGAKWVVEELFGYFQPYVDAHNWDGSPNTLPSRKTVHDYQFEAALICTREAAAIEKLRSLLGSIPCYTPASPLRAQSSVHLCRQLHSSLAGLGLSVTDVPSPRILVAQEAFDRVRSQMTQEGLIAVSSERTLGKQDFDPDVDQMFLLVPAVGAQDDARTWSRDMWATLVQILAEVGVVVVYYNPKDAAQRQSANLMVAGPQSFKSRFAIGLPLPELAAWACLSTVTIARDSGPMHVVAAAVGPSGRPRVIGLLSVMHPGTWKPLSESLELLGQWPIPLERCVKPDDVAVRAANIQQHWIHADYGLSELDGLRAAAESRDAPPRRNDVQQRVADLEVGRGLKG